MAHVYLGLWVGFCLFIVCFIERIRKDGRI